jgi:putative aldouronate transport system substrate-binding protein
MKTKKLIAVLTTLVLTASLFVGCGSSNSKKQSEAAASNTNTEKTEKITLTYWVPMHANAAQIMQDYNDSEVYKELEKRTGIHIEFIHPASGQEKEQFNLMIASGDLPDIIGSYPSYYPGGVDKAIEDGVYLRLNELIDEYAPNYKNLRESNKDIARETITDSGNIWAFSCIQTVKEAPWWGPVIRKDWLDELGLEIPTTIDEWEVVLRAFKEKKGAEAPLLWDSTGVDWSGAFISAYDLGWKFINANGEVKYSYIEPEYKDYLTLMNKWYKEGLIDMDFPTRDYKSTDAMFTSGKAGARVCAYGDVDVLLSAMKITDPKVQLTAVPYPSLKPGQQVHYRQSNNYNKGCSTVITSACKNPEAAVKWLDYAFGEEGARLFNYGIENVSYKMVDGKPEFTELITNNPDGFPYQQLAWKYKIHMGPYLRDYTACPPFSLESQTCMEIWGKADDSYVMPVINRTSEENRKYSSTMSEIETYIDEMTLKFIVGAEPLSNFDDYIKNIKNMGIDDMIKIQQNALDRYINR